MAGKFDRGEPEFQERVVALNRVSKTVKVVVLLDFLLW